MIQRVINFLQIQRISSGGTTQNSNVEFLGTQSGHDIDSHSFCVGMRDGTNPGLEEGRKPIISALCIGEAVSPKNILTKTILLIAAMLIITGSARAQNVQLVCATYQNTGKSYTQEAHVLSGRELNKLSRSYRFSTFTYYAILYWADDQFSVIRLDYALSGNISLFGTSGTDQRGYPWRLKKISSRHSYC